ncbi:hypothetical protein AB0M47_01745 [Hamadaea sp. NPDC051192]|uniref:hypothetical protein n=1 Tax=Hamadaea sp. NPDC051192 TaxID=3154940 RepID=UPI00342ED276
MRKTKSVFCVVLAGLLAAGCGALKSSADSVAGDAGDDAKTLPVSISGPQADVVGRGDGDVLRIKPAPAVNAPVKDKIEHALREDVLATVRVLGTTSANCADGITMRAGATSQCTVTYQGIDIPYEVKISDRYTEGSMVFSYTKKPTKGVLVAKVIYNLMNERYGSDSGRTDASKLACDEIPAVKVVEFRADTGYTCQYWGEHAKDGKPGYVTLKITMGSTSSSFAFDEVR